MNELEENSIFSYSALDIQQVVTFQFISLIISIRRKTNTETIL